MTTDRSAQVSATSGQIQGGTEREVRSLHGQLVQPSASSGRTLQLAGRPVQVSATSGHVREGKLRLERTVSDVYLQ